MDIISLAELGGSLNRRRVMPWSRISCWVLMIAFYTISGWNTEPVSLHNPAGVDASSTFEGSKAGDEREVVGIKLCWCPAGKFIMGSPRSEPERRPGEDQVEVTLTKGFWMAKYETTQGQWKRVMEKLPG